MTTKLSPAQMAALKALPCSITMWGGKPFAGLPEGIRTRSSLNALFRLGLAEVKNSGVQENWAITEAGRAALSAQP